MGDRIYRTNFLELDRLTFSFNMNNHLNPLVSEDNSLTAICEKISSYHQLMFPNWTRLRADFRIMRITSENILFQFFDANSRGKCLNWLIFSRVGDQIIVTHLGPLGKKKDNDFDDKVDQTRLSLRKLKDIWIQMSSSSMPKKEKEAKQNAMMNGVKEQFGAMMQAVEKQIEEKKGDLKNAIMNAFDSEETKAHLKSQIVKITIKSRASQKVLKAVMKEITEQIAKVIAKMAAKQAVKQGAKAATKGAAKITGKAVPFVGLAMGAGFGFWRLLQGDYAGAGMEIVSGAASCVPGVGTAAALAIDTGLLVKDVKNEIGLSQKKMEEMEALKDVIEKIEGELNDLFTKYDTAKAEHDFVCEVLGDKGYDFEKLEHDIGVVDEVLRELHNN